MRNDAFQSGPPAGRQRIDVLESRLRARSSSTRAHFALSCSIKHKRRASMDINLGNYARDGERYGRVHATPIKRYTIDPIHGRYKSRRRARNLHRLQQRASNSRNRPLLDNRGRPSNSEYALNCDRHLSIVKHDRCKGREEFVRITAVFVALFPVRYGFRFSSPVSVCRVDAIKDRCSPVIYDQGMQLFSSFCRRASRRLSPEFA